MHVFWQHNPAVNHKGMFGFGVRNRFAQRINILHKQRIVVALEQGNGKKPSAAWLPCASIIWHDVSIVRPNIRRHLQSKLTLRSLFPAAPYDIAPYVVTPFQTRCATIG